MSDTCFPNLVVPKSSLTMEVLDSSSDSQANGHPTAEAVKKTPAKRKPTPKKAPAKKDENEDELDEPTTPKPIKKRASKAKKESNGEVNADPDAEDTTPVTPTAASSKKRASKAKINDDENETPSKKQKTKTTTPVAKTPKSSAKATPNGKVAFPECFEDFSEGDKLLVRMRKAGHSWDEIQKAWTDVTGVVPGKDVLRKKETKLRAVAVEWKAGDARKLATFKAQVEAESHSAFKRLEAEKWTKMCGMFEAIGSKYSSLGLQKKWEIMQKKGEVDVKGTYIGDDAEITEADDAEAAENSGEADLEESGDVENDAGDADEEAEVDAEEA